MPSFSMDSEDTTKTCDTEAVESVPVKIEEYDFSKMDIRPRTLTVDRHKSCEIRALYDLFRAHAPPHLSSIQDSLKNLDHSKIAENLESALPPSRMSSPKASNSSQIQVEAWEALRRALIYFRGRPLGTIAAMDPSEEVLNYNQVPFLISVVILKIFLYLHNKIL